MLHTHIIEKFGRLAVLYGTVLLFAKKGRKKCQNPGWCLKTRPSVEPTTCLIESRDVRHFIDVVLRDENDQMALQKKINSCCYQLRKTWDCHNLDIYRSRDPLVLPRSLYGIRYFRVVWNISSLRSRTQWRGQHAGDLLTVILFLPEFHSQRCFCRPQQ